VHESRTYPEQGDNISKITILHLSDFHIKEDPGEKKDGFDLGLVTDPLKECLTRDRKAGKRPDIIAVTGDIAYAGKSKEYTRALEIVGEIRDLFGLDMSAVLIVPGNHDVDRMMHFPPASMERFPGGFFDEVLRNTEQRKQMTRGQREYTKTVRKHLPHIETHRNALFFVHAAEIKEKKVGFLGLNSSWMVHEDLKEREIVLSEYQMKNGFVALKGTSGSDVRVVMMHHPLSWLREEEQSLFLHTYLPTGVPTVILTGHTHRSQCVIPHPNFPNTIVMFGAGAVYADPSFRNTFHWVTIDFERDSLTSEGRYYDPPSRKWLPDHRPPRDLHGRFVRKGFLHGEVPPSGGKEEAPPPPPEIPGAYRDWIEEFHSTLPLDQLASEGEMLTISLPEAYISLETRNPFHRIEREGMEKAHGRKALLKYSGMPDEMVGELSGGQEDDSKEPPTIDIEALIGREGVNCILLRGTAGMGKTTLVKHLAYTITQGTGKQSLRGYLPVLVFLKDLWPIYWEKLKSSTNKISLETILKEYLEKSKCQLSWEVVKGFAARDRALFLLDGLDEIPGDIRPDLVEMIAEFRFTNKKNRFLLTGRPHGIDGKAAERFGDHLRDIEELDEGKIGEFIRKWFRAVSARATGLADTTAEELISDIRLHEHIRVFTRNPLLLTAVCILYKVAGKQIPEQQADLYDRIVKNLLYRRFHDPADPEKVTEVGEYLMLLAFRMMEGNLRSVEEHDAREVLKGVFPRKEDEGRRDYRRRIGRLFREIEPTCGLLRRLGGGELEFFHLTFQEFMAAKHMNYMGVDHNEYIEDEWWEETILLFLGLMNLDRKKDSNGLVKDILKTPREDEEMQRRLWLLGSKALRDFQKPKRDAEVVELARDKLLSLIESSAVPVEARFDAGELLGLLGDPRLEEDNFVEVPAGKFLRGSRKGEGYPDERPQREIYLDAFEIGKYPVTNQEFKKFVDAGGYEEEMGKKYWSKEGWQWRSGNKITEPENWHDRKWNGPNFPVVGVSLHEAKAFCKWLTETMNDGNTYDLPREKQWEAAARGKEGREYPWGNETGDLEERMNYRNIGLDTTSPVGVFPKGNTPDGISDMAGNVWEWCEDEWGSGRVVRGGSWLGVAWACSAASRDGYLPGYRGVALGFRLLRSLRPGRAQRTGRS